MRVEFEHAIVFGTFGEALSMRRGKSSWGPLLKGRTATSGRCASSHKNCLSIKTHQYDAPTLGVSAFISESAAKTSCVGDLCEWGANKKEFLSELSQENARIIRSRLDLSRMNLGERYAMGS